MNFPWWSPRRNPAPIDPAFYRRRWEAYGRHVREAFAAERIYVAGAHRASLTKSTRPGVEYQVTFWDGGEPTGHLDLMDLESAVRELWTFETPEFKRQFTASLESRQ